MHPWLWPEQPWQRVHVDFAGPWKGKMFFLLMDAHSKWPEIVEMKTTTAADTIAVLRRVFSSFGLPEQLVSDNGPQFVSHEFADFLTSNGVKHIRVAPYHPSSNGAVERFVQSFKQAMKAGEHDGLTFQHQLQNFLMTYRSTPHATTGQSPASLFLGRSIRTRFDLMRPVLGEKVRVEQARQKQAHDVHTSFRQFSVGTRVMIRNDKDKSTWSPGIVRERRGPVSYLVELDSGEVQRKHVDHLREWVPLPTTTTASGPESPPAQPVPEVFPEFETDSMVFMADQSDDQASTELQEEMTEPPDTTVSVEQCGSDSANATVSPPLTIASGRTPYRSYPRRQRKPTDRYTGT